MIAILNHYIDNVRDNLRLDRSFEKDIINELETHIEDRIEELRESGLSEEEAATTCMRLLGSAKMVARQIYEAHSQGTWKQTLLASMPHLLFALLFALNWWQGIVWLLAALAMIFGAIFYGRWYGKPTWLFPWLGYSLLPVVVAGICLIYVPKEWSWLVILIYIPFAVWLIYLVTIQAIREDWLYSSLMLLPVPTIIGWFIAAEPTNKLPAFVVQRLDDFAPWIGLSFLAFAATAAIFIRLRQRWLRIAVLFFSGVFTLTMVIYYTNGKLNPLAFMILILAVFGLILTPALLERRIRHSRQRATA